MTALSGRRFEDRLHEVLEKAAVHSDQCNTANEPWCIGSPQCDVTFTVAVELPDLLSPSRSKLVEEVIRAARAYIAFDEEESHKNYRYASEANIAAGRKSGLYVDIINCLRRLDASLDSGGEGDE